MQEGGDQQGMARRGWKYHLEMVRGGISRVLDRVEVVILIGGTIILTVVLTVNIIARTFFKAIYYIDELTQFTVIWTVFGGISYAVRKVRHIRMGAIFDFLPVKVRKILNYFLHGGSAIVLLTLGYLSVLYVIKVGRLGQTTPALHFPYWIFVSIAPLGFFAGGLQYVLAFLKNLVEKEVWMSAEQQVEYEDAMY
jgi:TRAP-type C4-dicarboxylate transport system permease small subunit